MKFNKSLHDIFWKEILISKRNEKKTRLNSMDILKYVFDLSLTLGPETE